MQIIDLSRRMDFDNDRELSVSKQAVLQGLLPILGLSAILSEQWIGMGNISANLVAWHGRHSSIHCHLVCKDVIFK